ncbi:DUF1841 family protein [Myxococcota bacterium]|nr:DUF1841 family protein [Myxococcota bacterium]MBU1431922.1 DUF1841 family protein [Myxococcota bacterium]MBU1900432.1 DUF1841 family protein [Myxococcota bacterium]
MSKLVIELEGIDKRHLAYVWGKMKAGLTLEGDEVYIGRSLADHPEWYPFFDTIGILEGEDELPDGSNPFAHVSMHILIGTQIQHQRPPEAETFYRVRVRKGDTPHDVIHMMINVFQRHLVWTVQRGTEGGGNRFDINAYAQTLKKLWKLKSHQIWARLGAE